VAKTDSFRAFVKDITLHIAAAQPTCVTREEVCPDLVAKEREIYAEQMKDKPANVIEKILEGKMDKFYSTTCLLEQGFIKDPDQTVGDMLKGKIAELGENIVIRRFTRYALGDGE
jgi:elongation factor Ts